MQEINLLQNKLKDKSDQFEKNNRMIMIVLSLLLTVVLVATGAFYMLTQSAVDATVALNQENVQIQTRLDQMESQMVLARGFQAQSKNITTLLNTHILWSGFVNELAASTFKTTKYLSMLLTTEGRVFVEGRTPGYTELGKVLLALETSKNIEEVTLLSTSSSETEAEAGVTFSIEMFINRSVLIEQN